MPGLGERARRLRRLARELKHPPAEVPTYYHIPPRGCDRGPGWYMGANANSLTYLGYSSAAAEVHLLGLLEAQERQGRKVAK